MTVSLLLEFLSDYTLRIVALGAGALGAVAGGLGCFAVLRRQSLLGDAIAHAALPGIVLAFMLTGMRTTPVLVLGAALAGWLGTLAIQAVIRGGRLPEDTALGIILSVFFGFGLVLLTFVQSRPTAAQAGLDTFLFGQAATLLASDVVLIAAAGGVVFVFVAAFWKEFKLLTFDPDYAATLGFPTRRTDLLLTGLLVVAIVLGLQTVGVVLMSALVVAPAAAARQWTDKLGVMVFLAAFLGGAAGMTGAVISATGSGIPTGPVIVLVASVVVALSLLAAPRRGLLAEAFRRRRIGQRVRAHAVLEDLWALELQHEGTPPSHTEAALSIMDREDAGIRRSLLELRDRGWVTETEPGCWKLTEEGRGQAAARPGPPGPGADGEVT